MMRLELGLALAALLVASTARAQAPAVGEFQVYQLPQPKRIQLPNGLVVLLLEKHELPLASVELALRSGSVSDPQGKEGLASITADLLRKGTATRSAEKISADMDFIGLVYDARTTLESTSVAIDFLRKDTDTALDLLADVVLHPTFPADEVKKLVAQRQDSLRSSKDNPQAVLGPYFMKALYETHPYGRPASGDEGSVATITREDALADYKRLFTPGNAVLAVVGDFDAAAMQARLQTLFGSWQGTTPPPTPVPAMKPITGRHVVLVDKPDATQTYFAVGNIGLTETSPDRAPVEVVNTLFGGRFTSMFNEELRVKSGYSYGANSSFQLLQTPGAFRMTTFTKNATTGPAIDKTFEVLARLHAHPFAEADLLSSKNYLRGTFPPSLETSPSLAHQLALLEVQGLTPKEFNTELLAEQNTTLSDANRVIDADFPTDNYVMVIIGKAGEIANLAAKYGTVVTKKISAPGY